MSEEVGQKTLSSHGELLEQSSSECSELDLGCRLEKRLALLGYRNAVEIKFMPA